ncbi:MAG: SMP-30/gluconolactonase/LRE family protein, partial [bacterium]
MLTSPDHHHPEVVLQHTCLLGEGPVWDANKKIILWIDLLNGNIHEFDTKDQSHHILELGDLVGAVALTQKGNYLAALKSGLSIVDRTTGKIIFLHYPEKHLPSNRFNDGKCDPAGRFWVGTMSISEEPGAGNVY